MPGFIEKIADSCNDLMVYLFARALVSVNADDAISRLPLFKQINRSRLTHLHETKMRGIVYFQITGTLLGHLLRHKV